MYTCPIADMRSDQKTEHSTITPLSDNYFCGEKKELSHLTSHSLEDDITATSNASLSHCGILWKRRDVFKKQWRERYFILNHDTGILLYYLLPKEKKLNQINAKTSDNYGSGSESE